MKADIIFECQYLRNGTLQRTFTARAASRPIGGIYIGGQCFAPSGADTVAGMSKRHTKAIGRANGVWWAFSGVFDVLRLDLYGTNAKPLGSIVARAVPVAFDCNLLGFKGDMPARAFKGEGGTFNVKAVDGSVAIQVRAQLALQRFWMHPAYGTPEFYYS